MQAAARNALPPLSLYLLPSDAYERTPSYYKYLEATAFCLEAASATLALAASSACFRHPPTPCRVLPKRWMFCFAIQRWRHVTMEILLEGEEVNNPCWNCEKDSHEM